MHEPEPVGRVDGKRGEPPLSRVLRPMDADDAGLSRRTRRSFLAAGALAAAGLGGWQWLRSRAAADGAPWPLRRALEANERVFRATLGDGRGRAATRPAGSAAAGPRVNGDLGLVGDVDLASYRVHVRGLAAGETTVALDEIHALPKVELTSRLCCIEGWSMFVNWGGCRFRDFAAKFPPRARDGRPFAAGASPRELPEYVGLGTPDGAYYVGLDAASAMHEQTLLCYEIDGKPLTAEHGAPLRLVVPSKYGIKNIKRIGSIWYDNARPADYWAEQGYDWFAGL